jgi:hypothetical protein
MNELTQDCGLIILEYIHNLLFDEGRCSNCIGATVGMEAVTAPG